MTSIGLVLSGGGMRAVAQIGAIKALEEHHIIPTHIAGVSGGSVVGALYAYGYDWTKILDFFKNIKVLDLSKYAINKPGILDAEKFYSDFKSYLKNDDFSYLKKPLSIIATNILNGKVEVFTKGELIKPILASSAIPGIFAPVKINNSYYVDGGLLNNFPVEILSETCDKIIGVYVNGFKPITISELKNSYNVIERSFKLRSIKEDEIKFNKCDIIIAPKELRKFGTFDKKNIDAIFNLGYISTNEALSTNSEFYNKPLPKIKFN